ncbi:hypothetical protein GCM10009716_36700 [Streptomyces sodiiphilus]|uniref:Carboxypeptidase regulatory-like domain-containing protein n=1 Tax=Streptomyces sodiiphilus TaxID=226217 RepID=A0ABN2PMR0_9ACTN
MLPIVKRLAARTGTALALAGTLIAVPVAAQAMDDEYGHDSARHYGSASATGLQVQLGRRIDVTAAEARYPEGPRRDRVDNVAIDGRGSASRVYALATGQQREGTVEARAGLRSLELDLGIATLRTGAVSASCTAGPDRRATGTSQIRDGIVDLPVGPDFPIPSDPAPNTTYNLPGGAGTAVLNEQIKHRDGSITVNAMRVTLTAPLPPRLRGEFTVASVTCDPGKKERKRDASITARTTDSVTGKGVRGVVIDVVDRRGNVVDSCVTGSDCTVKVRPGRYWVCVADVPEGYRKPRPADLCEGPLNVEAGERERVHFVLDPDRRHKK